MNQVLEKFKRKGKKCIKIETNPFIKLGTNGIYDFLNVRFGVSMGMFRKNIIGMTPVIMFFMSPSEKPYGKYEETNERDQCHENGCNKLHDE